MCTDSVNLLNVTLSHGESRWWHRDSEMCGRLCLVKRAPLCNSHFTYVYLPAFQSWESRPESLSVSVPVFLFVYVCVCLSVSLCVSPPHFCSCDSVALYTQVGIKFQSSSESHASAAGSTGNFTFSILAHYTFL